MSKSLKKSPSGPPTPSYERISYLYDDIMVVLGDIKTADLPNHADENYVLACNDYIRQTLSQIYDPDVVKKYLYDEILSQFVYQYFGELLYDCPYHFKETQEIKERLDERIRTLKKIPQMEQRSAEWYAYRNNRITASDFSSIFGKNAFKSREQLLQEKTDPSTINFVSNDTMLHGTRLEDAICQTYQILENCQVTEFGCLAHDTIDHLGASPDGITEEGVMLEIKCPPKRPIKGLPPIYYWCQIQLQLEVADLNRCDYVECKIIVISKADFQILLKNEPQYRCEAGCLIECWNTKENKLIHDYFPLGNNLNDVEKWEDAYLDGVLKQDNLDYRNTIYWQTKSLAKCTIYRDKRWFERCVPEVAEFWEQVKEGRELLANPETSENDSGNDNMSDNIETEVTMAGSGSRKSTTQKPNKSSSKESKSKKKESDTESQVSSRRKSKKVVCLISECSDSD